MKQQVFIASDHAGFDLKEKIKWRFDKKIPFTDLGIFAPEPVDYPIIAAGLAQKVSKSNGNAMGVLICGTGVGMSIVANKFPNIRAAVIYDDLSARMSRAHNNANIACLGARTMNEMLAVRLVDLFFSTGFEGRQKEGERHKRRVEKISKIEKKNFKKPAK